MTHKSSAFHLLESFITFIGTQLCAQVKIVRSDNGQEFSDQHALAFYSSKGIVHQTSCMDTPQQNGVVERKHKQLLEVARALMFQSKISTKFWVDCVLTATYLINRLPNSALGFNTPYELLYNKQANYEHLRTFGCFISTLKNGRSKFDPKAHPCIFLGYPMSKKAYKVYNLVTKRVHYSNDILFHEQHFPYSQLSSSDTMLPNSIFLAYDTSLHQPDFSVNPPDVRTSIDSLSSQNQPSPASPQDNSLSAPFRAS